MIRLAFSLIALLLAIGLFALTEHANEPSEVTVVASRSTTEVTAWPVETVPDLGPRFGEFISASKRGKVKHPLRQGYRAAGATAGSANGHACGGDLPPCYVMLRESGGNPRAVNPTGCGGRGCYGKWQYDPRTWRGYGGYAYASDAPESVQDDKARIDWAGGAGCHHWNACG